MTATTDQYFLYKGSHSNPADGRCAMEWVAYLAGEKHTDQPVCVSRVLRRFCIALNDKLPDEERQKLRPYLARCIGTAGDGRDVERVELLREWLVRTSLPRSLDLAGRHEAAERLRTMPVELTAENVRRLTLEARNEARSARSEALAKLRARYADAVVAVAAAADAAVADADDAADDGAEVRRRARAAAEERLRPAVEAARRDAFDLLERMLPTEVIEIPVAPDAAAICTPAGA